MNSLLIDFNSPDWRASRLSNLSSSPFVLEGEEFASVEGFIQHLNFPYGDFRRDLCKELDGIEALAMAFQARDFQEQDGKSSIPPIGWGSCFYLGEYVGYSSPLWEDIIERAMRAKFEQHDLSRRALERAEGLEIAYEGYFVDFEEGPLLSLDPEVFLRILNGIINKTEVGHGDEEGAI